MENTKEKKIILHASRSKGASQIRYQLRHQQVCNLVLPENQPEINEQGHNDAKSTRHHSMFFIGQYRK